LLRKKLELEVEALPLGLVAPKLHSDPPKEIGRKDNRWLQD